MFNEIPIFKIGINDNDDATGVQVVSFVSSPAIEEGFIALSKTKEKAFVALADDVKQIITGPALIPDIEILRLSEEGEAYKIVFEREAIEGISKKFFRQGNIFNTNFEHEGAIDGNYIAESWLIKDSENDKAKSLGFDLPAGTWMLSYHVPDLETYNALKEKASGFSIEGRFVLGEMLKKHNNNSKMEKNNNLFSQVMAAIKPLFFNDGECATCGNKENKEGEKLGSNLSGVLNTWIDELENREDNPISRADTVARIATEAGIEEGTVNGIISGDIECPPLERIMGIARALPNANLEEVEAAWMADGCGVEEEEEQKKEEVAEVVQTEVKEEVKAEVENAELTALNEKLASLASTVETLKEALENKTAEIAELKKQPAGSKVITAPGADSAEVVEDLSKLPFHVRYIAGLKKVK